MGVSLFIRPETLSKYVLLLLFLADLLFILLHGLFHLHLLPNNLFSLYTDAGYAEIYQYGKEIFIVACLCLLAARRKQLVYLPWALLFLYIFADDSLRIHERLGSVLAQNLNIKPVFGLRSQDLGELGVFTGFGIVLLFFIGAAYISSARHEKVVSRQLFYRLLALAFFGIFIDGFHVAAPWGQSLWGTLEDGGELLIMSMILTYVFSLNMPVSKANG